MSSRDQARSSPAAVTVAVPATTANLGPGFDCLGLTLDLWNRATFALRPDPGVLVSIEGEGAERLSRDADNLAVRAFLRLCDEAGEAPPAGLELDCRVGVPLASGLGSSASAVVAGLLGANELLGRPAPVDVILQLATEFEGHPDNVAAALLGGLVIVVRTDEGLLAERIEIAPLDVALAVPQLEYSTTASRAELPPYVALSDAVYNMGRVTLVVEALRRGDLDLLGKVMDDRLHQARRLERVPGGVAAMAAARAAGAAAVAVSGSGPSLIAFPAPGAAVDSVAAAMVAALGDAGVRARPLVLATIGRGAEVTVHEAAREDVGGPEPAVDAGSAAVSFAANARSRGGAAAEPARAGAAAEPARAGAAAGFEITEHTADVGLRAWGPSEAAVFEQAALGMLSLMCDPAGVAPLETYSVVAEAPAGSPDALLVAWLNELLYRVETDGIVFSTIAIDGLTHRYLSARLQGEPIDLDRHAVRLAVKAATYHDLSVRHTEGHWEATVLLDV
jgi:homoserine kinase